LSKGFALGNPTKGPRPLETQGRAGKPKGVPDADAFIQKWDFKGPRPLMGVRPAWALTWR
jgi:hypothetical protein